ncbi:hypothetical protein EYZ11_006578 [Aspergillus tanneri]|uniref:Uncharacterized protein n=1 Tax=Aspergillus tanneri TaxID=1220188 RepID=A0A4S3JKU7_9EURO|nr:hypothetical protein EYZ11_006578 [Aspergillus tanneri]
MFKSGEFTKANYSDMQHQQLRRTNIIGCHTDVQYNWMQPATERL